MSKKYLVENYGKVLTVDYRQLENTCNRQRKACSLKLVP